MIFCQGLSDRIDVQVTASQICRDSLVSWRTWAAIAEGGGCINSFTKMTRSFEFDVKGHNLDFKLNLNEKIKVRIPRTHNFTSGLHPACIYDGMLASPITTSVFLSSLLLR
jgi:hypothetical protein